MYRHSLFIVIILLLVREYVGLVIKNTTDGENHPTTFIRVLDREFSVFSNRKSWADAVFACSNEGLEIGQVRSIEEAHAIAVIMITRRPGNYINFSDRMQIIIIIII